MENVLDQISCSIWTQIKENENSAKKKRTRYAYIRLRVLSGMNLGDVLQNKTVLKTVTVQNDLFPNVF